MIRQLLLVLFACAAGVHLARAEPGTAGAARLPAESQQHANSASSSNLLAGNANSVAWFVQLSDLHINKWVHHEILPDLQEFGRRVLTGVRPGALLITGDLVDAKTRPEGSQQHEEEWQAYERAWRQLAHPTNFFGVAGPALLQQLQQRLQQLRSSSSSSGIADVALPAGCSTSIPIISYSHYPFSTVAAAYGSSSGVADGGGPPAVQGGRALRDLLCCHDVSAHLSGHLHDLLGPRMQVLYDKAALLGGVFGRSRLRAPLHWQGAGATTAAGGGGAFLADLESADWKQRRRWRLMAVDTGSVSFADLHFRRSPCSAAAAAAGACVSSSSSDGSSSSSSSAAYSYEVLGLLLLPRLFGRHILALHAHLNKSSSSSSQGRLLRHQQSMPQQQMGELYKQTFCCQQKEGGWCLNPGGLGFCTHLKTLVAAAAALLFRVLGWCVLAGLRLLLLPLAAMAVLAQRHGGLWWTLLAHSSWVLAAPWFCAQMGSSSQGLGLWFRWGLLLPLPSDLSPSWVNGDAGSPFWGADVTNTVSNSVSNVSEGEDLVDPSGSWQEYVWMGLPDTHLIASLTMCITLAPMTLWLGLVVWHWHSVAAAAARGSSSSGVAAAAEAAAGLLVVGLQGRQQQLAGAGKWLQQQLGARRRGHTANARAYGRVALLVSPVVGWLPLLLGLALRRVRADVAAGKARRRD
ncbi:hypothetical protein OEZ86_010547 [Tetradesmus obliquus]|nr:hypothetical protein OEZ86_010547 [Tetradesmus obliquus]